MNAQQYGVAIATSFTMIIISGIFVGMYDPNIGQPIMLTPMFVFAALCIILAYYAPIPSKEKPASELVDKKNVD